MLRPEIVRRKLQLIVEDLDRRLLHAAIETCLQQYPHYVAAVERYLTR